MLLFSGPLLEASCQVVSGQDGILSPAKVKNLRLSPGKTALPSLVWPSG